MRPAIRTLSALGLTAMFAAGCGDGTPEPDSLGEADAGSAPTSPLDPDIWIAALRSDAEGGLSLGPPAGAIHRQGYDNQPRFAPDGRSFWFSAHDEHAQQNDIWLYRIGGGIEQVTMSAPESEYSPAPLPDGSGLAVVRVEADSTQRLWRVPFDGSEPTVLLPDVAPVGYFAWVNPTTLALFVLGEPPTLRVADLGAGTARVVAEGIGPSIQTIPGQEAVSFVLVDPEGRTSLARFDASTGAVSPLVETVGNGAHHAWTPDGRLLMAEGASVYSWAPGEDGWSLVADLSARRIVITRLAVSPDGTQIALVVEPGDLPL